MAGEKRTITVKHRSAKCQHPPTSLIITHRHIELYSLFFLSFTVYKVLSYTLSHQTLTAILLIRTSPFHKWRNWDSTKLSALSDNRLYRWDGNPGLSLLSPQSNPLRACGPVRSLSLSLPPPMYLLCIRTTSYSIHISLYREKQGECQTRKEVWESTLFHTNPSRAPKKQNSEKK